MLNLEQLVSNNHWYHGWQDSSVVERLTKDWEVCGSILSRSIFKLWRWTHRNQMLNRFVWVICSCLWGDNFIQHHTTRCVVLITECHNSHKHRRVLWLSRSTSRLYQDCAVSTTNMASKFRELPSLIPPVIQNSNLQLFGRQLHKFWNFGYRWASFMRRGNYWLFLAFSSRCTCTQVYITPTFHKECWTHSLNR